ncbi:MAG: 4-(cytidine 5'-diphospho)-2-C-methyl-D-erythritol kinase [Crocinitomicaceae bacterium]
MVIFPGCKINIGLSILDKREDGYHNLESVFYPLSLTDILEVVEHDHFSLHASGLSISGNHSDNLVVKAYYNLQDDFNLPPVKIHLHKNVPMGAGLGGGSADGAAMLLLLDELFKLELTIKELEKRAAELGSDCPFFIHQKPAYITGKGENVQPLDLDLNKYYIQLVNPGIYISTKEAFRGVKASENKFNLELIQEAKPRFWKHEVINDFEQSIVPEHTEISELLMSLKNNGALYISMTGTGSSVYGIFDKKPSPLNTGHFEWINQL